MNETGLIVIGVAVLGFIFLGIIAAIAANINDKFRP